MLNRIKYILNTQILFQHKLESKYLPQLITKHQFIENSNLNFCLNKYKKKVLKRKKKIDYHI